MRVVPPWPLLLPLLAVAGFREVTDEIHSQALVWQRASWPPGGLPGEFESMQAGGMKDRSTVDHLVTLETTIRNGFVKGEHVIAVFFDLEMAYDLTWKQVWSNERFAQV